MMKSVGIALIITLAAFSVACDNAAGGHHSPSSPPPTMSTIRPTPSPRTVEELCAGLTWPRTMPTVAGLIFDDVGDSLEPWADAALQPLACLGGLRGVTLDGTVVWEHSYWKGAVDSYRIVDVSPQPGTLVRTDDPVTIHLVLADKGLPSAYRPCDWVSVAEVAKFFDGTPVSSRAWHDTTGSTDYQCRFERTDNNSPGVHYEITSELRLTGPISSMPHPNSRSGPRWTVRVSTAWVSKRRAE